MNNPLLSDSLLPLFNQIEPYHALIAVKERVSQANQCIDALMMSYLEPSWENLMQPLDEISALIQEVWSPIGHLNAVKNTPEWRDAYHACLPILTEFSTQLGQNHALYQKVLRLSQSENFSSLNVIQKKIIHDQLRDFRLSGVALNEDKKQRYAEIQQRLSVLGAKFEENVLDATRDWYYVTDNLADLVGLPEHVLAFSRKKALDKGREGCYFLTLDAPCYIAVMKYADNSDLRCQMYHAYTTRASDQGPRSGQFDNTSVMLELLQLKQELAHMLNFKHYADYSLATKMAGSVNDVMDFLLTLAKKSRASAEQELLEINRFANDHLGMKTVSAWDIAYVSEKLQHHQYAINEELLRPYFPIDRVLSGMFGVINHIYGMRVIEKSTNANAMSFIEVWHPDVRFFEIYDSSETLRGQFYLDLFAREGKRGGAWMDDCRSRRAIDGRIVIPVAYLNANFSSPQMGQPALLTHDDVITLFHEFGHGLHHLLTQINEGQVSGINGVEWDAVELPSQFMENFCWQKNCIPMISSHVESQEPLPDLLFQAMLNAKNFQSGMQMLRQIEFSLFDITLYSQAAPTDARELQSILDAVRQRVSVVISPEFNRFQHSFSHIFSGGYSAGYYSYKWAEVLSSDVFLAFEEDGVLSRKMGEKFLHDILERGGSEPMMDLFKAFRGREPSVDALLRYSGLR